MSRVAQSPSRSAARPARGSRPSRIEDPPAVEVAKEAPSTGSRVLTILLVAGLCLFVFLQLRPGLILAPTTPGGGDLTGHSWGVAFLRAHLWGAGGFLSGWSDDWFAGFPAFRFYMPVPALGAVLLDLFAPSGVALKIMAVFPLVLLPAAAAWLARRGGWGAAGPAMAGAAALVFLFDSSHFRHGGNIFSTLLGEYGQAGALAAGVATLAVYEADLRRGRRGPASGLMAAATCLFHPVGALFVAVALCARTAFVPAGCRRAAVAHLGRTAGVTILLGAFWYLPLWAHRAFMNELGFPPVTDYGALLFPYWLPVEIGLAGLAVLGVVTAVRRGWSGVLALAVTAVLFAVATTLLSEGTLWNARLAPVWQLCRLLVAGAGAAGGLDRLAARVPAARPRWLAPLLPMLAAGLVVAGLAWDTGVLPGMQDSRAEVTADGFKVESRWIVGPSHQDSQLPGYLHRAFGGLERGVERRELETLKTELIRVAGDKGCGRVFPEYDPSATLGSVYALNLLPQWTGGCLSTVTGLYYDSTPTSAVALLGESTLSSRSSQYEPGLPYEPLDVHRGVSYLREFGARYYLAFSQPAVEQARRRPDLEQVAAAQRWTLFALPDAPMVEPLAGPPVVFPDGPRSQEAWEELALAWFRQARPEAARITWSGPAGWPRVQKGVPPPSSAEPSASATVSDVRSTDGRIRFRVSRTGVPILVRQSYFPTWQARGADGPWRVTPNWMVVVPTDEHVDLTYRAGFVAWSGFAISVLGLALVAGSTLHMRFRLGTRLLSLLRR